MSALRRLVPYYRPYRRSFLFGLVLIVIAAALASVVPWLLRAAIDRMRAGAPVADVIRITLQMVGIALVAGAARYGMRELMNGISRRIEYDLRNDLFAHLQTLDAGFFAQVRTGDIMARLTNDLSAVRMASGPAIMYLVNTLFGGLFALAFMLRIDVALTGLALLPMIALPLVMARLGRAIHVRFEAVQENFARLTTLAQENLSGTRIVRAYRQEEAEIARFGSEGEEYLARNLDLARLYGIMHPAFGVLAGLGALVVLGVGGTLALRGRISLGAFVAFGLYLSMLTWPLISLGWVTNLFQRGAASMLRLLEILDRRPAITAPAVARHLPPNTSGRSIELRHVGFHFPAIAGRAPRWVLRGVSLMVAPGATVGIVGATGSGKSTLLDLLARFHDPQEGEILIDGVPIREIPLAELRSALGYVTQESLLFSDTVAANLAYGGASDADVRWAAGVAELDRTIAAFPGGYETILGERGINLSGGQKQRAALARALARRPGIVLLDDALSAVDTHTEAAILRALREALAGRTALIASHRVSAIRDATEIVVLDAGRIVERGQHDALLAAGGRYRALLSRQQLEDALEEPAGATA